METNRMETNRYFYCCTVGKTEAGDIVFNTFDIISTGHYPTLRECEKYSDDVFPGLTNVTLVGISEMTRADFDQFASEQ